MRIPVHQHALLHYRYLARLTTPYNTHIYKEKWGFVWIKCKFPLFLKKRGNQNSKNIKNKKSNLKSFTSALIWKKVHIQHGPGPSSIHHHTNTWILSTSVLSVRFYWSEIIMVKCLYCLCLIPIGLLQEEASFLCFYLLHGSLLCWPL